jgi:arylsulfatase A-like enzyme
MNRFLEMCRSKEWFHETLFVITADHGHAITNDYAVSESCFHIPLLFYSPAHITPEVRSDLVSQMDIVPTAMSMLGIEFDNHTFGIDVMGGSTRRMIPSTTGQCIIARDNNWLYISDINYGIDYLYDLSNKGEGRYHNVASSHSDIVATMDEYVRAVVQAGWDIHNTPLTSR